MESLLLYILKASGLLSSFFLVYQLFLKKETFYAVNRHFLILGLLVSLFLPFIAFTQYIEIEATSLSPRGLKNVSNETPTTLLSIDYIGISFIIYTLGVLFLLIKFALQLLSIIQLIKTNKVTRKGRYSHIEISTDAPPFSFFNYIFYNPEPFTPEELSTILRHEEAHSSQWHSVDVLLSQLVAIILWINPFSWYYQLRIRQNLEFMADASATDKMPSLKSYQYTLLKVSGETRHTALVNNFYNSLIKKRIVMLNKSKSKNSKILKTILILPILVLFLVSFNTKTVYVTTMDVKDQSTNSAQYPLIEIAINKTTSDKELNKIKKDLLQKGVNFSYTVVHNSKNEITDIDVHFTTTNKEGKKINSSSNFSGGDEGIDPILILYDETTHSFSIASNTIQDIHKEKNQIVWVTAHGDNDAPKTIEIVKDDGEETIKVNGKKISREELEALKVKEGIHKEPIKIRKSGDDPTENIFVVKISDEDTSDETETITKEKPSKEKTVLQTVNQSPLIIIDGREADQKEMKAMDPSTIASVNVLKGEAASKKYGGKGTNGVIEITSKKE